MNTSVNPVNDSTSISPKSKELVLNVEGLAMTAMTMVSDGVDAVSKDLWVVVIDNGGGWYGRGQGDVVGHKRSSRTSSRERSSCTDKLIQGLDVE